MPNTKTIGNTFTPAWPASFKPAEMTEWDHARKTATKIATYICFPILLVQLFAQWLNRMLVKMFILPAAGIPTTVLALARSQLEGEEVQFFTPDGVKLDGRFYEGIHSDKVIVYIHGNAATYEMCTYHVNLLRESGACVLTFNSEGIGRSDGFSSPERLSLGVYSAFEYLKNVQGFDLRNTLLYGYSQGGAYGNTGLALLQQEYPDIPFNVINDRSYSTMDTEVRHLIDRGPYINECASRLLSTFGWEIDSTAAFSQIKGKKCILFNTLDKVIPYEASLYASLTPSQRAQVHCLSMHNTTEEQQAGRTINEHLRSFNPIEKALLLDEVSSMLNLPLNVYA
jgi:hypothetical protein